MKSFIQIKVYQHLKLNEVCRMFRLPPTKQGRELMRRRIVDRIRRAKGALDKWDPRVGYGPLTRYKVTRVHLKKLFPEHFDDEMEIGVELRSRIQELRKEIETVAEQVVQSSKMGRARDNVLAKHITELRKAVGR